MRNTARLGQTEARNLIWVSRMVVKEPHIRAIICFQPEAYQQEARIRSRAGTQTQTPQHGMPVLQVAPNHCLSHLGFVLLLRMFPVFIHTAA